MLDALPAMLSWLVLVVITWIMVRTDVRPARVQALIVGGAERPGTRIVKASAWTNRRVGLLNHASLGPDDGLWIQGAKAIHMVGMLFPVDVVFLDARGKVLAVHVGLAPGTGRIAGPRKSAVTLELASGAAGRLGIDEGVVIGLG